MRRKLQTSNCEMGKLYVVSTPIGNLKDITLRALEILKGVDIIACEDTRHTRKLLSHYSIKRSLVSYFEHNKFIRGRYLVERLKEGKRIALVSDSGTPGISDPGYYVINLAIENEIEVVPIPGASALLCGLTASGCPTDRFAFEGYLPQRKKRRRDRLLELRDEVRTAIFYEAPHRLLSSLKDIQEVLGDRKIVIGRELTKRFEEIRRGEVGELIQHFIEHRPRGEFVIILPKGEKR